MNGASQKGILTRALATGDSLRQEKLFSYVSAALSLTTLLGMRHPIKGISSKGTFLTKDLRHLLGDMDGFQLLSPSKWSSAPTGYYLLWYFAMAI